MSAPSRPLDARFTDAVRAGDVAELRRLRPRRAELRSMVNAPTFDFDTPAIVHVAGRDDVALVDALLDLGADPNARSAWWAGPFHALHSASGAVAERLLAAGAVPDACAAAHLDRADLLVAMLAADPARVHERGGDGQTPLHFARSRRVAALLLDAGADLDARDTDHRSTPAEWMLSDADDAARSRTALAAYLVERGATADVFLAAALGLTARVRAMLDADATLLALRTGQGIYGERRPSSYHIYQWAIGAGRTPLQAAARFGQRDTVTAMLAYASPAQRLMLACHDGRREDAGAVLRDQPDAVASLGLADRRALADEAWAGNAAAVALMLSLGFDPAVGSGANGGSALHCAAWEGSAECVAALLADPRGRALLPTLDPHFGATPLGWCCHGSVHRGSAGTHHAEVARRLLDAGSPRPGADTEASDAVQAVLEGTLSR